MINNKKGFTLVELLAVIVILAIVALVGTTAIGPVIKNARKSAIVDEAGIIADAVTLTGSMVDSEASGLSDTCKTLFSGSGTKSMTLTQLASCGYYTKKNTNMGGAVLVDLSNYTVTKYCIEDTSNGYMLSSKTSAELNVDNVTQDTKKTKIAPTSCP